MLVLKTIYEETLARCAPEALVQRVVRPDMPRDVIAIGKCAARLAHGVAAVHDVRDVLIAAPEGYAASSEAAIGGHPYMTASSFEAGARVARFAEEHDDILFLISGGGSACVELPLGPWFEAAEVAEANRQLVDSGLTIREINTVRKHLSSIKGGRLGARVRGRSVTLVYSDVSTGALADVASGPTMPDETTNAEAATIAEQTLVSVPAALYDSRLPQTPKELPNATVHLIADNATLTETATAIARGFGLTAHLLAAQIESDVESAAQMLAQRAASLRSGEILVAGGEPTVARRGSGRGGRCSELAVRFARAASKLGLKNVGALFAGSDGVDGNSGAAGIFLDNVKLLDPAVVEEALVRSDSFSLAATAGEPVIMQPTGNNLRDLFLLARG